MNSPFGAILREAVEATPGALSGVFAAGDGEPVDIYTGADDRDWPVVAAHYGVIVAHVQAALSTLHYGEAESVEVNYPRLIVLLRAVQGGYYAMLGLSPAVDLATARSALSRAAEKLREEME